MDDIHGLNSQYISVVHTIHNTDSANIIDKSMKSLNNIQSYIRQHHPEFIESITDIDYQLACAAFRINKTEQFEQVVQQHYFDDYRFKRLYQTFIEAETTNAWKNIIKSNAQNMEKTFVRSLSVIILTGVCVSLFLRK